MQITRSVLDGCKNDEERGAVLQIDHEEAFDRLRHSIVFGDFDHVGPGVVIFKVMLKTLKNGVTRLIISKSLPELI